MYTTIDCPRRVSLELFAEGSDGGFPLHTEDVTADLGAIVDETYTRAVLADVFDESCAALRARVEPSIRDEPFVEHLDVVLEAERGGELARYRQSFLDGRWSRRALVASASLRAEGALREGERARPRLVASGPPDALELRLPPLQPPVVEDATFEELGVRDLGDGALVPDRPVLVHAALEEELVRLCQEAGPVETGGAVLGRIVRLPRALPGASSRVVTLLTTLVGDERHVGQAATFEFNPEALAAAAEMAELRGLGEQVLTVAHTHGWGTGCDECNAQAHCTLAQCTEVSVQDYQVLESLFPSKATLMPIAGRRLGAAGRRPVLALHAWMGGGVRPIRWRRYTD